MSNPQSKIPSPGTRFHFVKSGFVYVTGQGTRVFSEISRRGQTIEVTEDMISASLDRNGRTWLQYIHDEQAQIDRWGFVYLREGEAPASLSPWDPDSAGDRDQHRARVLDGLAGATVNEREAARQQLDKELGKSTSSVTLNSRGGQR